MFGIIDYRDKTIWHAKELRQEIEGQGDTVYVIFVYRLL